MKKALAVLGILVVCGGVAAFVVFGQDGDQEKKSNQAAKQKKNKNKDVKVNVKSGSAGQGEYEQIEAAVSAEYTESYVADVEVNGGSATATLDDGTQVPLELKNGEWVPQVDAPQASAPDVSAPEADVPQASAPEVSTPQVQTPSTPAAPSGP